MDAARAAFIEAVGNDLNTSLGVTAVYDALKADVNDATKRAIIADFDKVLGLDLLGRAAALKEKEAAPAEGAEEIEALIAQRAQAKKEKNWARRRHPGSAQGHGRGDQGHPQWRGVEADLSTDSKTGPVP